MSITPYFDLTDQVDLSSTQSVLNAINATLSAVWGKNYGYPTLRQALSDTAAAFRGDYPGLLRCDTQYHDLRHAFDATLAMARLAAGYARGAADEGLPPLDAEHALLGVLLTLFHDIGLLRHLDEAHFNGAALSHVHERRSVAFARSYLLQTPLAHLADKAELIMVTRMITPVPDALSATDRMLASLVGTADMISQLSDRYYLERCRDFLFEEYAVIGRAGHEDAEFPDQETLLRKTPEFFIGPVRERVRNAYGNVLRFMRIYFDGECPYTAAMEKNFAYLQKILARQSFELLRRHPPRLIDSRD